jgi:hypothetical protein
LTAVAVHVDLKTRHKAHGIAIGSDPSYHHAMCVFTVIAADFYRVIASTHLRLWVPSDLQTGIIRFDPTLPPGTARQININTVEVFACPRPSHNDLHCCGICNVCPPSPQVWGCAVPQAMQAQAFQRAREAQAVEQRQKVVALLCRLPVLV